MIIIIRKFTQLLLVTMMMRSFILSYFLSIIIFLSTATIVISSKVDNTNIKDVSTCTLTCEKDALCYASSIDVVSCLSSIPFNKVRLDYISIMELYAFICYDNNMITLF